MCKDPGQILHGTRNGTTGPLPVGSVLTYTCNSGYYGGGSIICGYWATWSRVPICQSNSSGKSVDFNKILHIKFHSPDYSCSNADLLFFFQMGRVSRFIKYLENCGQYIQFI